MPSHSHKFIKLNLLTNPHILVRLQVKLTDQHFIEVIFHARTPDIKLIMGSLLHGLVGSAHSLAYQHFFSQ